MKCTSSLERCATFKKRNATVARFGVKFVFPTLFVCLFNGRDDDYDNDGERRNY